MTTDQSIARDNERLDQLAGSVIHDEASIEQLRMLRAQLAALIEREAEIVQAVKDVKAKIAAITGGTPAAGVIDLGAGLGLKVSYRNAFDADLATNLLGGSEVYASICESKPSAKLAKAVLAPAVYEMCQSASPTPSFAPVAVR